MLVVIVFQQCYKIRYIGPRATEMKYFIFKIYIINNCETLQGCMSLNTLHTLNSILSK